MKWERREGTTLVCPGTRQGREERRLGDGVQLTQNDNAIMSYLSCVGTANKKSRCLNNIGDDQSVSSSQ